MESPALGSSPPAPDQPIYLPRCCQTPRSPALLPRRLHLLSPLTCEVARAALGACHVTILLSSLSEAPYSVNTRLPAWHGAHLCQLREQAAQLRAMHRNAPGQQPLPWGPKCHHHLAQPRLGLQLWEAMQPQRARERTKLEKVTKTHSGKLTLGAHGSFQPLILGAHLMNPA